MNNFFFKISRFVPFGIVNSINSVKIFFPFYHSVSDNPPIHLKNLYKVKTISEFEKDIDFFLGKYQPIDLSEIKEFFFNTKTNKKKSFFLSFDDGLSEIYSTVAPILKKRGIPAAFFVNSSFVDNKDMFYRYKVSVIIEKLKNHSTIYKKVENYLRQNKIIEKEVFNFLYAVNYSNLDILEKIAEICEIDFAEYLQKKKPYLTIDQINELIKQGFYIGAHSANHFYYSELSEKMQIEETIKSIEFIDNNFKTDYKIFAFPFTDDKVKSSFFNVLKNKTKIDFTFGTAGIKKDFIKSNLQRIPMENGKKAQETIKYELFYSLIRSIFGKNLIQR